MTKYKPLKQLDYFLVSFFCVFSLFQCSFSSLQQKNSLTMLSILCTLILIEASRIGLMLQCHFRSAGTRVRYAWAHHHWAHFCGLNLTEDMRLTLPLLLSKTTFTPQLRHISCGALCGHRAFSSLI